MVRLIVAVCILVLSVTASAQSTNAKKLISAADYYFAGQESHEKGNDLEAVRYYDECLRLRASYKEAYLARAIAEEGLEIWRQPFAITRSISN